MKSKIGKNYLYNLTYQILLIILPIVTTPYISRVLGAENIGKYSYISSVVSYFILFATMGFNFYGQREIAYMNGDIEKQSVKFFEVLINRLITTVIALTVYFLVVFFISKDLKLYLVQSLLIVNVCLDISWFYQGIEDFKSIMIRNLIVRISSVALIFVFVRTSDDLLIYILIQVLSNIIGSILLWQPIKKYLRKIKLKNIDLRNGFYQNLELFIPIIATQIYNVLDKTMIGVLTNNYNENGYYEQTTKLINLSMTIITSLGVVLLPYMSKTFAQNNEIKIREISNTAFKFVLMLSCPIMVGMICVSDGMVPWFFGNGYEKVKLLLKIYSFVLLLIPLSNLAGNAILTPTKQHRKGTCAVVIGAVINFLFNCFLIPRIGSIGASIATVIAELTVTTLHLYFIRTYIDFKSILLCFFKYIIASIFMGIVMVLITLLVEQYQISAVFITFIQIVTGIITYFCFLLFVIKDNHLKSTIIRLMKWR